MWAISGDHTYDEAAGKVKEQIDSGLPGFRSTLRHKDARYSD